MPAGSPLSRTVAVAWALPVTLVGMAFLGAAVVTGGQAALVAGALEGHGGVVRGGLARLPVGRGGAAAITLGHVILGTDAAALTSSRAHERVHVAQYERWGLFLLPAYAASSVSALLRGQNPYRANRFEKEATTLARARSR